MSKEIKIFISYAHEDLDQVRSLYHRLKEAGFSPWLDKEELLGGVKWRGVIEKAILDADFFLLCLSSSSSNRRGFIQREIKKAFDLWEAKLDDDIYFIPLRLEDCEIPERVDEIQCVNLFEKDGWDRLLKALHVQVKKLGREIPKAAAPPTVPARSSSPQIFSTNADPYHEFEFTTVTIDANGREIGRRQGRTRGLIEDLGNGVLIELAEIRGGEFWMGSTDAEVQAAFKDNHRYNKGTKLEWYAREAPRHRVTVSNFFMGRDPVTQAEWTELMGDLPEIPAKMRGDDYPIVNVSWVDANDFCRELSRRTKHRYRLPTEAEWEYAARAGTIMVPYAYGQNINPLVVNYAGTAPFGSAPKGTYRQAAVPVGSLGFANAFGLFDMHGNVWEWCSDWFSDSYYKGCRERGTLQDPTGPSTGSSRVARGGGWNDRAVKCRSANRAYEAPGRRNYFLGFRLVRIDR